MKEKKLACRLAKGDIKALEKIIDTYSGYVRTVARNISQGIAANEDIDEITADVFYNLWKCRENINEEIGLRPYLSAAARNAVKDYFKKNKLACEDISELEISSGFLVEDRAEINEMMNCLNRGINQLPAEEQEIFLRFYFYGEKSSQIANAMKMAENTVRTKLRRTRAKLKKYMEERGFDYV